jgi:two-component system, LuxR family, sensor kinase FixL
VGAQVSSIQTFSDLGERDHSLFRTLIKTTVDGVVVTGEDGIVQIYNAACARLFQYAPEEVLGCDVRMLVPSQFKKLFDRCSRRGLRGGNSGKISVAHEIQGVRRDGSLFPMHLSVRDGHLDGSRVFLAVIQDLTALHRERTALDEEKAYLALITESSDDAIISYMLDGTIRSWNRAAEAMFGYQADEIIGANAPSLMPMFVPPDILDAERENFERVLAGENVPAHESVRYHKDGTPVQVRIKASPIRDANGTVVGIARTVRDIRERKAHEKERALLGLAVDSSDLVFTCIGLDGTILNWNRGAEQLLGFSADEAMGNSAEWLIPQIVPAELVATEFEYSRKAAQGEKIGPLETVRTRKDGSRVQVLSTISPVRDSSGKVIAIARTLQDLSQRKVYEQQRALLSAVVDSSSDAIISYDLSGAITSFNRAAEAMYGYSADEVIGMNVLDTVSLVGTPEQRAEEKETLERLLRGESIPPYERLRRRRDGAPLHALVSISTIRDPSGKIIGTSRIVRDVGERKAYEQQRALLSSIIETSNDAIYTKTLDSIVTSWNAAAEAMFGYKASEIVGKSMLILVPPDGVEEEAEVLKRTSAGETIRHYETVRVRKDGSLIDVSVTISPLRDAAGTIVGASKTIRDITERKAYEARLQSMREDMIHVARVQELSQVSAGIAHELNQPLAAMMNYSNVARRLVAQNDPAVTEKLPGVVSKLGEQAERAGQIIRRMRDFVEKRTPHRAVENINTIADDAVALGLIGAKAANIETRFEHEPNAPLVFADRVQIQQVLVNLLRNATEAMAETSRRELTLCIKKTEGNFVEVAVADTGTGIPENVAARLFTPFVTTKDNGMGIGLAISKSIIEAHGGELIVRSNPGGGTVFHFTLPAA